jgi:hypothetical protein
VRGRSWGEREGEREIHNPGRDDQAWDHLLILKEKLREGLLRRRPQHFELVRKGNNTQVFEREQDSAH